MPAVGGQLLPAHSKGFRELNHNTPVSVK